MLLSDDNYDLYTIVEISSDFEISYFVSLYQTPQHKTLQFSIRDAYEDYKTCFSTNIMK